MVDESTRAGLEIALRAALHDQARANATVDFLREKLGLADTSAQIILGPGEPSEGEAPQDVGPIQVHDAEFFGMSQPRAAALFLERAGRSRPQRTDVILAALKKGGIEFKGKDPGQTFYTILARNTGTFKRVGRSTWGLTAWYPNAAKASKPNAEEARPDNADDGDRWGVGEDSDEEQATEA